MTRTPDPVTLVLRMLEACEPGVRLSLDTPGGPLQVVAEGGLWADWRLPAKRFGWDVRNSPWAPNLRGGSDIPPAYSSRWLAQHIAEGTFAVRSVRGPGLKTRARVTSEISANP